MDWVRRPVWRRRRKKNEKKEKKRWVDEDDFVADADADDLVAIATQPSLLLVRIVAQNAHSVPRSFAFRVDLQRPTSSFPHRAGEPAQPAGSTRARHHLPAASRRRRPRPLPARMDLS
ncbi:hypothetical protein U9M48_033699 [Paspalum notatum var. saurae]|uniref:Uncharacterized protein n=1 Tax=Paspalum notatum var. saurae TaxID=547442 RepID=A0AAQ3X6U2_PASNO